MKTALIGYTGFVGGNISKQRKFDYLFNTSNIDQIKDHEYDLIVSCATSSLMWKANLEPEKDWQSIKQLINHLKTVKAGNFVLISTIFVYPNPYNINEDSEIDPAKLSPYGLNRYKLEQFVKSKFPQHTIIRLPNLYGQGLKKNFIYDLIYNNRLDLTHKNSRMQWYNLDNIWSDINIALVNNLSVVNFSVQPISAHKIAKYTLGFSFKTVTEKPALNHNMLTKYGKIFGVNSKYLYNSSYTLNSLKEFIVSESKKIQLK